MFPSYGRNPLDELVQRVDHHLKRIAGWETKRRRAEILDQLADQISYQWEKSTAYTNVIVAVGYAGLFTTWATLGPGNHPRLFIIAGLLALVSLMIFILWEVFKMTLLGRFMQLVIPQLDADPHRVDKAVERIKELRTNINLWFARTWLRVLIAILAFGLSSAVIVIILFVTRLF